MDDSESGHTPLGGSPNYSHGLFLRGEVHTTIRCRVCCRTLQIKSGRRVLEGSPRKIIEINPLVDSNVVGRGRDASIKTYKDG